MRPVCDFPWMGSVLQVPFSALICWLGDIKGLCIWGLSPTWNNSRKRSIDRLQSEFGVIDMPLDWLHSYLSDCEYFVTIGQHQSDAVPLNVGVPQGSVLGPQLFAVYCSPVADVISEHGISYHQYTDDTQMRLSLRADNTAEGLAVLATCTSDIRHLRNGLQLNPYKSEALIVGTTNQLQVATASLWSMTVAGVDLLVADKMKVLGVVLDRRLSLDRHATSVARACNYHVQAIRYIHCLLTTELALTLACSLILSRLDYCNALLHGAPANSIYSEAAAGAEHWRIVLQITRRSPSQPLLQQLHWLPVRQQIDYKLAILTYKIHHTSTPVYLSRHIQPHTVTRRLRSSAMPRLCKLTTRTNFADRGFCCSAPAVWNSLTADIVDSSSLPIFKSKLNTFLFKHAFSTS